MITGATAGIGAAFARKLAADGYRLVLVARDAERLASAAAELSDRHAVPASALPADLTTEEGCAAVSARLADPDAPVDLLVNSAGMGLRVPFLRSGLADEEHLLRLNVQAVLRLTSAVLPAMAARGHGAVINVSSVAGFGVPAPGSTYSASKAWVTNFSESIAVSVRPYGVRVMALCPGYTRTEFHDRAGIDIRPIPAWLWLDAESVVATAMRHLAEGRLVSVPDWKYKLATVALRYAPTGLVAALTRDPRGRLAGSGRDLDRSMS